MVQVICGYQLPYKSEKMLKGERSLSVQVRVIGVDDDVQSDRTRVVKNNGQSYTSRSLFYHLFSIFRPPYLVMGRPLCFAPVIRLFMTALCNRVGHI